MPTVTSTLQAIFDDVGEPILIAALNLVIPGISVIFNIPIVGSILSWALKLGVDRLIAAGVIEVKLGILDFMSAEAKIKYAAQVAILNQIQSHDSMTPEEEAAYEKALQGLVQNHHGVVNS